MRQTKLVLVVTAIFLGGLLANAQSKTLTFKKGEVLDILLFSGKPDFSKLFPRYKETAFTFALKTGYQPQLQKCLIFMNKEELCGHHFIWLIMRWKRMFLLI